VNRADTFIPSGADSHLWVVVSDPARNPHEVVLVNLSTQAPWKDNTCVVLPHEHAWVQHPSVVMYGDARIESGESLRRIEEAGLLDKCPSVSDALMARILEGFDISAYVKPRVRQVLVEYGLLQQ